MIRVVMLTIIFSTVLLEDIELYLAKAASKPSKLNFSFQEKDVPLSPSLVTILGQNFVVGIRGKTLDLKTKKILQYIEPAGIILYYRNYKSRGQLKKLIADLQQIPKKNHNYSYFIMIDEEPGGATRLDLFNNVFAFGYPEWSQIENDIEEMAKIGINVNLAPLADFPFNDNSFIERRVKANTCNALIEFNQKFIALLKRYNISATLKHFPGMGVFVEDPHIKLPLIKKNKAIISESIRIFKKGIDGGADFVMTGHAVYDDIEPNVPATLSEKIVTKVLRNDLGFSGLAITDDLSEMPFNHSGKIDLTEATMESLKAGHNLVLFSHKLEKTKEIFDKLLQRAQYDYKFRIAIENNYRKIIFFKHRHSIGPDG